MEKVSFEKIWFWVQRFLSDTFELILKKVPLLKSILKLVSRFWRLIKGIAIPGLLILLILLPAIISGTKEKLSISQFEAPIKPTKGDLQKTIRSTATVEFDYIDEHIVYQTAKVTDVLVNEGDKVIAKQTLANLDFIQNVEIRTTEVDNQILALNQELANLDTSRRETIDLNTASLNQNSVKLAGLNKQIADIESDIYRVLKNKSVDLNNLDGYIDTLNSEIEETELATSIADSIREYDLEIDQIRAQVNSLKDTEGQLQISVATQQAVFDACLIDCNDKEALLEDLEESLGDVQDDIDSGVGDIEDLEDKIDELEDGGDAFEYEPQDKPIADQTQSAAGQRELSNLKTDISEVKGLQSQLITLLNSRDEFLAAQNVQNISQNQSVSSINQRIATSQIQMANLQRSKQDLLEDIEDQTDSESVQANREGIASKIYFEGNTEIPAGRIAIDVVSKQKVLRLNINAKNRESLVEGLKAVIVNPENEFERAATLSVDAIGIAPIKSALLGDEVEYEVEINLPDGNWIVGKDVDVDIVLAERKDTLYVPATAVFENKIFVAKGEGSEGDKPVFDDILEVEISIGLNSGRFLEVKDGISEHDKMYSIYPRTEEQKTLVIKQYKR